eukprot:266954-Amphidinium_carterae.1
MGARWRHNLHARASRVTFRRVHEQGTASYFAQCHSPLRKWQPYDWLFPGSLGASFQRPSFSATCAS